MDIAEWIYGHGRMPPEEVVYRCDLARLIPAEYGAIRTPLSERERVKSRKRCSCGEAFDHRKKRHARNAVDDGKMPRLEY